MPTAFTHALVGASAAQLAPAETPRLRLGIFFAVAAALPDLDVVAFRLGIAYADPLGHRGFSHSLLFALLLGSAAVLLLPRCRRGRRRPALSVAALGAAAVASHGVLDAATDAGLGIGFFVPFSRARFFFPFRPIETASVDPARFFSPHGLEVLGSEVRWVWLPLLALTLVHQLRRRTRAGSEATVGPGARDR